MNGWLFRHHRHFGIVSCLALLAWSASGVLHPLISRLGPQAAAMAPPPARLEPGALAAPGEVLGRAGFRQATGLRLVALAEGGRTVQAWQLTLPGEAERRYVDAVSGALLPGAEARHAVALARHFSGDARSAVRRIALVTRFDDDYRPGNRLLPVVRVDFERPDGLRAYVDTGPPRLASLTNDRKAALAGLFRALHNWTFLEPAEGLRLGLASLLLAATLACALSGLWMYGFLWRRGTLGKRHRPLWRWHRGVGLAVSLSALGFVLSAQWHLLRHVPPPAPPAAETLDLARLELPAALRRQAWGSMELAGPATAPYFRAVPVGHGGATPSTVLLDAAGGAPLPDAERHEALRLAAHFSGLAQARVREVRQVTRFEHEYRAMNRRLPVWRVAYDTPDAAAFYVEPGSGALAAAVRRPQRWEGWSFGHLHMFHWLDFAGRDLRDLVLALFGLGNLLVAALGLWLFARRTRRRRSV